MCDFVLTRDGIEGAISRGCNFTIISLPQLQPLHPRPFTSELLNRGWLASSRAQADINVRPG